MIKQIKNAICGPDGKMEMKEMVSFNLLLMVWFMLITGVILKYEWSDAWVVAIPLSLVGAVFGTIYQKINQK